VLRDYRFQFNINILSEGVMITNFISKSFEFIELLICEKIAGLFLLKRNDMKNCKGTLTSKMPFAARFSCCATVDFNSILIYFPRGYDNKFYIKIFGIYRTIDLLKIGGVLFLFKRNDMKNCKGALTPKMPFAARLSCCAMVVLTSPVKCLFPTLHVCTLWLGCTVSAWISSPNA